MQIDRRTLIAAGTSAAAVAGAANAASAQAHPRPGVREEKRSLEQLHRAALAEGGEVIIYAGGDTATQQDSNKQAFESAFPGVTATIIVDYSKFHDARVDNQLATDTLVPDVVQLQTTQDFDRWKRAGVLARYKPAGYSAVRREFKDPDGYWIGIFVDAFSIIGNPSSTGGEIPRDLRALLEPRWKSLIVSTYPNDDDAVLFLYERAVRAYGWEWLRQFVAQDIDWVRGTQEPADQVEAGDRPIAFGTDGALNPGAGVNTRFVIPRRDPFMAWAQRAAILRDAARPATAKLYLNWWLSRQVQASFYMWSVRSDVPAPRGYRPIWEYPNANVGEFVQFMSDRARAERFRQQVTLHVGEVTGDPSPGWLGLHPGR